MRGRAIAGLARTPRRSLIVLKLEKTCQLFVTYIYTYIQGATHKPHTYLFCFVMSFSWLNAFKCSADSKWKPGKGKGKAKNQNQNPKPKIPKAAQAIRHRQPKNVSAVAVDVGVAVANYMLTRTRKLISHLAQNLKCRRTVEPKSGNAARCKSTKRFRKVFSVQLSLSSLWQQLSINRPYKLLY